MVNNYFKKVYTAEPIEREGTTIQTAFPTLLEDNQQHILKPFIEQGIKIFAFGMTPQKASGPDDYHLSFFQQSLELTGIGVCDFAIQFFLTGQPLEGTNDTLSVLIPKVQSPEKVSQLRPISFCNVIYKIITKALPNRLKSILPEIISP